MVRKCDCWYLLCKNIDTSFHWYTYFGLRFLGKNVKESFRFIDFWSLLECTEQKINVSKKRPWNQHEFNKWNGGMGLFQTVICYIYNHFIQYSVDSLRTLNSSVYTVLVRPQLEYCSKVWCPFTDSNIAKLEAVKCRAARWIKHGYGQTSSVTDMMQFLHWRRLD